MLSLLPFVLQGVNVLFMLFVFICVSRYPTRLPYQMMFVSFDSTTTGPTGGTGTTYPSNVETTKQRLRDLRHHLKRRRYNDKVIGSEFSKASEINRNDLLEYKEIKINKRVPLVLTYIPLQRKFQALSVIIGKKLKKVKRWPSCSLNHPLQRSGDLKALRIHWSELRYLDLHRRSASVNHVVTSVASAVSNCNTHTSVPQQDDRKGV